jgi:hypothetical protein
MFSTYSVIHPLVLSPAVEQSSMLLFPVKATVSVGQCKAMKYFIQDNVDRLTWLVPLFNGAKGKGEG